MFFPSFFSFRAFHTFFFFGLSFHFFIPYTNFSLFAVAISPWISEFTPAKAFVRELKCLAITKLAGSITCRVTQFLRGSLLLLFLLLFTEQLTNCIDSLPNFVVRPNNLSGTPIHKNRRPGLSRFGQVHFFKCCTKAEKQVDRISRENTE